MRKWIIVSLLFIVVALPGTSRSERREEPKKPLGVMEEIVVTAGRIEEKKEEVTSNVMTIDEEEIRSSSAKDLGDLLAEKGVGHIQKGPGKLTTVGIRGFRTEALGNDLMGHILVLINGRRAGTGNLAKIKTKNIDRVEIIRGPASVQYGSAAMGGVINVITKQGEADPKVFVEGILGSFGYQESSVGFSGKVDRMDFSGSFTKSSMDDYDTADGERYENTGFDDEEAISLNLGFEPLPGHRVGLIYNAFDADRVGNPGYLSQNDLDDFNDTSNDSIDINYSGDIRDGLFSWMVRYFDGKDEGKWSLPIASNPDFWDDGVPIKMETDQKGAQGQVSLDLGKAEVTTGFDWVEYEINATSAPKKTEYENPSYFLLAKTGLFDKRIIVSGGVRYDDYEVKVKEPAGRTEDDDKFSPQLGLAFLCRDYLKLRLNYGEAFKMPAADQLAADYVVWGIHYMGNPDLDPEKSRTYEGGIDFSHAFLSAALTYFYTDFEDKIEPATQPGGISTWENLGNATISGVEGDFSFDMGSFFNWGFQLKPYVGFVFLDEYEDEEKDTDLKYTSKLHLSYGVTASDSRGFKTRLNFAYTGEQEIDDWQNAGPPTWVAPVVEKSGFTVVNLTMSKRIVDDEKYGDITLKGEIQNLLDKDYEYVKDYPMSGRSFFIGMRYDY